MKYLKNFESISESLITPLKFDEYHTMLSKYRSMEYILIPNNLQIDEFKKICKEVNGKHVWYNIVTAWRSTNIELYVSYYDGPGYELLSKFPQCGNMSKKVVIERKYVFNILQDEYYLLHNSISDIIGLKCHGVLIDGTDGLRQVLTKLLN